MSDLKTIAVESSTKAVLGMLKQHPRETYDDVIRRLVDQAVQDAPREQPRNGAQKGAASAV